FFYSRFPEPKQGETFQALSLNQKLYYHRLGTPQADDVLVWERPDEPRWTVGSTVTDDGRYLILSIGDGTTSRKVRIFYKALQQPDSKPVALIDNFDSKYSFIDNDGPVFFFRTELTAPRGRVIAIDTRKPEKENWKEVIPEAKDTLESVHLVGDQFIADY